jgi:UDP-3-O-[3-hydroxymyristoyl] N-acetylglucosamine deacetylase
MVESIDDIMRKSNAAVQHTLKAPIHCTGVGLHSGVKTTMTLRPAAVDTGIVFRRIDLPTGPVEIRAVWSNAVESPLCSLLRNDDGVTVSTIEHLMAALHAASVDNAVIELDGAEVPIMDGSSAPFTFLIECAGLLPQAAPRRVLRVLKTVRVENGLAWAEIVPDELLSVECTIDFESKAIARQSADTMVEAQIFKTEIGRARTFCFLDEVAAMRKAGLARGGSLDNAIVVDGDTVLNEEGLRYVDEFVRHKTLDAIGDLYMAGGAIVGRFRAHRPGHALTRRLLATLFADDSAWTLAAPEAEIPAWDEKVTALSA